MAWTYHVVCRECAWVVPIGTRWIATAGKVGHNRTFGHNAEVYPFDGQIRPRRTTGGPD